jgi:hypothetical protein
MFAKHLTKSHNLSKFSSKSFGIWSHLKPRPADPILGLVEEFKKCTATDKINLSAGTYKTNEGKPYVLNCVKVVCLIYLILGSKKTCRAN